MGIVLFLLGLLVQAVVPHSQASIGNTSTASDAPADPDKSEKQRRDLIASNLGSALKASLRNPASLVVEDARSSQDGNLICVKYRAQNGFGGMNIEFLAVSNGKSHQTSSYWNKHCTGELFDETVAVKYGANGIFG